MENQGLDQRGRQGGPLRPEPDTASTAYTRMYANVGAPCISDHVNVHSLRNPVPSKPTEPEEWKVTIKLALPSFGYRDLDPADLDLMTIMRQIERRYTVKIELPAADGAITVKAQSKPKASEALMFMCQALQSQPDDVEAWHPQILVAAPSAGRSCLGVRFEKAPAGARPVLPSNASSSEAPENEEFEGLAKEYQGAFREKMLQIAGSLRSCPNEMQMRINFGTLRLHEWKKDKDIYSYDDLEVLARRSSLRGTFKLDKFLGATQFHENIMTKIYASTSILEPLIPRIPSLEDVPAIHSLILRTAGLDLEAEVIAVLDNDQKTFKYRLGPVHGFRREKRHQAVEIITSCPDSRYDWNLVVRTQVKVDSLPFTHRDLQANTRFKAAQQSHSFPELLIRPDFAKKTKLQEVLGKTSFAFRMTGTPYLVEASLFHRWQGSSTNTPATLGSGVTLSGVRWDEELGPKDIGEGLRLWSDDFCELFPRRGDKDGFDVFFRSVKVVQDMLGEVAEFEVADDRGSTRQEES